MGDAVEYSYVLTPAEMKSVERILQQGSQEDCDLLEHIFRQARVKWYDIETKEDKP